MDLKLQLLVWTVEVGVPATDITARANRHHGTGSPAESEGYPQRSLRLRKLQQFTREKPSPCQPYLDRHYFSSPGTTGGICFSVDIPLTGHASCACGRRRKGRINLTLSRYV